MSGKRYPVTTGPWPRGKNGTPSTPTAGSTRPQYVNLGNRAEVIAAIETLNARNGKLLAEVQALTVARSVALRTIAALVERFGEDGVLVADADSIASLTGNEHVQLTGVAIKDDSGEQTGLEITIAVRQATAEEKAAHTTSSQRPKPRDPRAGRIIIPAGFSVN